MDTQTDAIMHRLFGSEYSPENAEGFWQDANNFVFSFFHRISEENKKYQTVTSVFEQCYAELFPKHGIKLDPKEGAYVLASAHADSLLYNDSQIFLERVQRDYLTCVISDTDAIIIDKLLDQFHFDHVFTSEEFQSYKFDSSGNSSMSRSLHLEFNQMRCCTLEMDYLIYREQNEQGPMPDGLTGMVKIGIMKLNQITPYHHSLSYQFN